MNSDASKTGRNATQSSPINRIKIMQKGESSSETLELKKLPKHFRKKFYHGYDPRFVIILLSSLFLHTSLFLYLSYHLPKKDKTKIARKVHDQFAKLLVEGKGEFPPAIEKIVEKSPELYSNFNLLQSFLNEFEEYDLPIDDLLDFSEAPSAGIKVPSSERARVSRAMAAERRSRAKEALIEDIGRIGLLGVLTSGSGVITYAEIADILQFADSTAGDLEKRLAFLTSLRVPRAVDTEGVEALGKRGAPSLLTKSDFVYKPPSIKGHRTYTANVQVDDFVEKLGLVKEVPVKKVQKFEDVPSSYVLSSLGSKPSNGMVTRFTRDPDEVRQVVLSHYSAIQDCYTQALKTNPDLKGKIVVRFVVSPEGDVISASVVSSSISDQQMIDCMLDRIARWRDFSPLHPSANRMTIKQAYVFGF